MAEGSGSGGPRTAQQVALLIVVGAVFGALLGRFAEAQVLGVIRAGGVGLVGLESSAAPWIAAAGACAGPLLWAGAAVRARLLGPRAWSLLRLAWGPAVGLPVGLIGAAMAAARVLVADAVAEAAADPARAISIDPAAIGLPGWALAGVAGGALVSVAVSLVAAEEPDASASAAQRSPRDARK